MSSSDETRALSKGFLRSYYLGEVVEFLGRRLELRKAGFLGLDPDQPSRIWELRGRCLELLELREELLRLRSEVEDERG